MSQGLRARHPAFGQPHHLSLRRFNHLRVPGAPGARRP
jgi:hypothetical protein